MSEAVLLALIGIALSAIGFVLGKIFAQSEKILDQKRRAYEDYLLVCPAPNEAHCSDFELYEEFQRRIGVLTVYASEGVVKHAGAYLTEFGCSQGELRGITTAGHPVFDRLMVKYNRMVWAMRVDAMTWSIFAPKRSAEEYHR